MSASSALAGARDRLAKAEARFRSVEGLAELEEGLALLEEVVLDGTDGQRTVADNLLATYADRLCAAVRRTVENDPGLPEPELQHLFRLLVAFDAAELDLPDYVRALKIDIARRLIERYYEGYPAEEKQKALEQLAGIADV
jgi:hypothetical protein